MHTHKGALKIITVEIEAYKASKAHTHTHTGSHIELLFRLGS